MDTTAKGILIAKALFNSWVARSLVLATSRVKTLAKPISTKMDKMEVNDKAK